jgi:hypothetical protein
VIGLLAAWGNAVAIDEAFIGFAAAWIVDAALKARHRYRYDLSAAIAGGIVPFLLLVAMVAITWHHLPHEWTLVAVVLGCAISIVRRGVAQWVTRRQTLRRRPG